MPVKTPAIKTFGDLLDRLGGVPPSRVLFPAFPGNATLQDVIEVHRKEGKWCELVEGVLVEKAVGYVQSALAGLLISMLNAFVLPRNLGVVTGEASRHFSIIFASPILELLFESRLV